MPETGLYINAVVFMSIQQAQKKPNEGVCVCRVISLSRKRFLTMLRQCFQV